MKLEQQLQELAVDLFEVGALVFGDLKAKSGLSIPYFIDLRIIISNPQLLVKLSDMLWKLAENLKFDVICGLPLGSIPLASVISVRNNLPMLLLRKEPKTYGTKKVLEGKYEPGQTCIMIDDVIDTGGSILDVAERLEDNGLQASYAIVVVDRERGGKQRIEKTGIKVKSLYTETTLMTYLLKSGKISDDIADCVSKCNKASVN